LSKIVFFATFYGLLVTHLVTHRFTLGNPILAIPNIYLLREGVKKNTSFYPHLVDKGARGWPMWISKRGQPMWINNFFIIIL
jgi:hypothetical protein